MTTKIKNQNPGYKTPLQQAVEENRKRQSAALSCWRDVLAMAADVEEGVNPYAATMDIVGGTPVQAKYLRARGIRAAEACVRPYLRLLEQDLLNAMHDHRHQAAEEVPKRMQVLHSHINGWIRDEQLDRLTATLNRVTAKHPGSQEQMKLIKQDVMPLLKWVGQAEKMAKEMGD